MVLFVSVILCLVYLYINFSAARQNLKEFIIDENQLKIRILQNEDDLSELYFQKYPVPEHEVNNPKIRISKSYLPKIKRTFT